MDDTIGNFEAIPDITYLEQMKKEKPLVFKVGEILEIRGSRLRVERISKHKLTLKLLPALKSEPTPQMSISDFIHNQLKKE